MKTTELSIGMRVQVGTRKGAVRGWGDNPDNGDSVYVDLDNGEGIAVPLQKVRAE